MQCIRCIKNFRLLALIIFSLFLTGAFSVLAPYAEAAPTTHVMQTKSNGADVYKPRFGAESLKNAPGSMTDSAAMALPEYVEGEVLVVIEAPAASAYSVMGTFSENNYSQALASQAETFASEFGLEALNTFPEIANISGKSIIRLRSEHKRAEELLQELASVPDVVSVSLNYIIKLDDPPASQLSKKYNAFNNDLIPNDPDYPKLWGMENIGMPHVWDYFTGNDTVVVAVIDSGIDYTHPDIESNMARDSYGNYGRRFQGGTYLNDPFDINDHGTHVAGTIGAVGNNGIGVAGVNWQVKMLAVNVLPTGSAWESDIIAGMNYVLSEKSKGLNIRVANMSFGSSRSPEADDSPYGTAVKSLSDANIICTISAGNDSRNLNNSSTKNYPACFRFSNTIAVGAIDVNNARSVWPSGASSNYGDEWVDIAAPGSDVYSTIPGNSYSSFGGTSMAAPHVAGAAAILCAAYPNESASQIKARILSKARNIGVSNGLWTNGILNVWGAYGAPEITTTFPPGSAVGLSYSHTLRADGIVPIAWTIESGNLPNGLNLNATTGEIYGTPSGTGTFNFTVKAENSAGSDSKPLSMVVTTTPVAPIINTATLPDGVNGFSYSQTLNASGTAPITWTIDVGNLPNGLNLNSATGEIYGTPSSTGAFNFTVRAANTAGSNTRALSILIPAPVSVTGVSLNYGGAGFHVADFIYLTATVFPTDASNKKVTWSSDNPAVATVNDYGLVTAVSAGTATITVTTVDGGFTDTCIITASSNLFQSGNGTPSDPFIITTEAQLRTVYIIPSAHYKLGANIDLTPGFTRIGGSSSWPFTGSFDGNGYKISGLQTSLFGYTFGFSNCIIKNLGVEIASTGSNSSGLVYSSQGNIENCYVTGGDINSTGSFLGGLVGLQEWGVISNCYATVNVSGTSYIGGLVGWQERGSIENSYATGNVNSNSSYSIAGGLVGYAQGPISNSYATGDVSGGSRVGGLAGYQTNDGRRNSNITNCYATGNVNSSGYYVGGLVGHAQCFISNSYAKGDVSGDSRVGGLVGLQERGSIENSYAASNVNSSGNYVGGLVGHAQCPISNNYAKGDVSGGSSVGGLVGWQERGSIENSYATGNVNSSGNYVGGLVGDQYGSSSNIDITNCYATGNVSGAYYVGGLIGDSSGVVSNNYSTGNVSGNNAGGVVGRQYISNSVITNSYRYQLATVNGAIRTENTPNGVHGGVKTALELMTKATYTGNFWLFNDSAPTAGLWHWDERGFPKLNIGAESFPFPRFTSLFPGSGSGTESDPYVITTVTQLVEVRNHLGAHFALSNDIDLTAYLAPGGAGHSKWGSVGWQPAGTQSAPFTGSFNGNGHKIIGLRIDRVSEDYVGLFGYVTNAEIKNLGVEIAAEGLTGQNYVGGIVGYQNNSSIANCYVTGNVNGYQNVGGLAGYQINNSSIANCYVAGNVNGYQNVGGLAGVNVSGGSIINSYSTSDVSGDDCIGGLAGRSGGEITNCYATGNVSGGRENVSGTIVIFGGLVGSQSGRMTNCYFTGNITGIGNYVGGLVGQYGNSSIANSYRYQFTSVHNDLIPIDGPESAPNRRHGGVVALDQLITKATYTGNGWLFNDSSPSGPWHWDSEGFPKLNLGSERFPFDFTPTIIRHPENRTVAAGNTASFSVTAVGIAPLAYQWQRSDDGATWSNVGTNAATYSIIAQTADDGVQFRASVSNSYGSVTSNVMTLTMETTFPIGNGTTNEPYIITTAVQLDEARNYSGAHYRLGGDIDLGAYLAPGGAGYVKWGTEGWAPIGTGTAPFIGSFDGNGHKITGLWIDRSNTSYVGLFGYAASADIKNIGVEISAAGIAGWYNTGGLTGYHYSGVITNCYVTGAVSGNSYVGGLVGYSASFSNIENCYATGNVSGSSYVGGLVGYQYGGGVTNCYATGNVSSSGSSVGGLVGRSVEDSNITNSYATGNVSGGTATGGLAGQLSVGAITNCYAAGNVSGSGSVGGLVGSFLVNTIINSNIINSYRYQLATVNGSVIPADDPDSAPDRRHGGVKTAPELMTKVTYTGNSWLFNDSAPTAGPWHWDIRGFPKLNIGAENFPFSFPQLPFTGGSGTDSDPFIITTAAQLDEVRNYLSAHFILGNNIDLTAYLASGGAGYAKWGASGWEPIGTQAAPFIGSFDGNGHKITGLWIARSNTEGVGLFGFVDRVNIKNIGVEISAKGIFGWTYTGGLVGYQYGGGMTDCYATGDVSGGSNVGGLAGVQSSGNIANCYATGDVSGSYNVGGLAGVQTGGYMTNCYATGGVRGTSQVGGLTGYSRDFNSIANCYATGAISGNYTVGGLVGENNGNIENCYATGDVSGTHHYVGGLAGRLSGGGIINSYATGNVSGDNSIVGGLVGEQTAGSSVTNSYTTGDVSGSDNVGGLAGRLSGGGIINSYTTGNVRGNRQVGGLVGDQRDNSSISNSYATGNISGSGNNIGGLVGNFENSSIINSYRYQFATINGEVSAVNTPNGVHGGIKTATELMTKATYTGNSWLFNDSAPTAGSWYWDSRGFPKLNIGTENFPFGFDPGIPIISITSQPASNTTVTQGNILGSLSVTASVTQGANLTYQWYRNTLNSNEGGIIETGSGATSASLVIPRDLMTAGSPYYFYCVVSAGGAASVHSDVATVMVTGGSVDPTGVSLNVNSVVIAIGGYEQLRETVSPANATDKSVRWTSGNPAVATVSNSGLVTGVTSGKAIITVETIVGGFSDTCEVTVSGGGFNTPPGISGPVYMELNSGYAATASNMFSITGAEPVTVTKTSGNASITWDNANKKLNIAAGLPTGSYPVVLTANNGIAPNATHTFTLTVINVPSGSARLYFTPENITAGMDSTFTVTFKVNSEAFNQVECVLAYDPEFLELEAVTQIPPSTDWMLFSNTYWGSATFLLTPMIGGAALLSGDASVATLRFKALRETSGTEISIIQLYGNGAGSSKLQHNVGGILEVIPFTTQGSVVTIADGVATLKASFQGRSLPGAANMENLTVKWISGAAVIAEETVITDQNGEAAIAIPSQNSGLTIWVKGERTLAASQYVGTVEHGSLINIGTLSGGDSNGDNVVDLTDFNAFLNSYGSNADIPGFNRLADFNNDGVVDLSDFNIFLNSYGKTGAQLPAGSSSMMSINEESEELNADDEDFDNGCNVGMTAFALLILAAPLFRKNK